MFRLSFNNGYLSRNDDPDAYDEAYLKMLLLFKITTLCDDIIPGIYTESIKLVYNDKTKRNCNTLYNNHKGSHRSYAFRFSDEGIECLCIDYMKTVISDYMEENKPSDINYNSLFPDCFITGNDDDFFELIRTCDYKEWIFGKSNDIGFDLRTKYISYIKSHDEIVILTESSIGKYEDTRSMITILESKLLHKMSNYKNELNIINNRLDVMNKQLNILLQNNIVQKSVQDVSEYLNLYENILSILEDSRLYNIFQFSHGDRYYDNDKYSSLKSRVLYMLSKYYYYYHSNEQKNNMICYKNIDPIKPFNKIVSHIQIERFNPISPEYDVIEQISSLFSYNKDTNKSIIPQKCNIYPKLLCIVYMYSPNRYSSLEYGDNKVVTQDDNGYLFSNFPIIILINMLNAILCRWTGYEIIRGSEVLVEQSEIVKELLHFSNKYTEYIYVHPLRELYEALYFSVPNPDK